MASTAKLMGTSFKAGRRAPRRRGGARAGAREVKEGAEGLVANPYLHALMKDRALRSDLESAYGSLSKAYGRASRKNLRADLLEDRKARRELTKATTSLRAATERLSNAKSGRRPRRGRMILLVATAGGVGALALSEDLRNRLMGAVSGGGTSPSGSSNGSAPSAAQESSSQSTTTA